MKYLFYLLAMAGFACGIGMSKATTTFNSFAPSTQDETTVDEQPVELGKVKWLRDIDAAIESSKSEDKPIALLFQEVPG